MSRVGMLLRLVGVAATLMICELGFARPALAAECEAGAKLAVSAVAPREGPARGANKVEIIGCDFSTATANGDVSFGTSPLKRVTGTLTKGTFKLISNTQIEAEPPAHEPGTVAVTVHNGEETSGSETEPNSADEYTYEGEATTECEAAGKLSVVEVTVRESGSSGGVKGKIIGEGFCTATANADVEFGTVALKHVTGTLTKGSFKVLSNTEIEFDNPFHEHARVAVTVTNGTEASAEPEEPNAADEFTYLPEVYRNETAPSSGTRVPILGYGQIRLGHLPHPATEVECVNVGFGAGWNEPPTGETEPVSARGEVLVWWASGHAPSEIHSEISSRCRFIYETEEALGKVPQAWVSAEAPLHKVEQTAIVCINETKQEVIYCPLPFEEHEVSVVDEVSRETPSLPWNIRFTERAGKTRVQIGLPEECSLKEPSERTELTKCGEGSEREPGKSPAGCVVSVANHPAPPGCVKVTVVSTPALNVELPYEGYVEPLSSNGAGSGLSPASWAFEGEGNEECLRLRTSPASKGCATGAIKLLGYSNQELVSIK